MNLSLEELPPALRQDNFSLPNGTALLQQLDTIDNAACGWIQFMSKVRWVSTMTAPFPCAFSGLAPTMAPFQVSVDIFKGFPDEESIVNYTLNQAYQDNVTVFASEFLPLPQRSCVSYRPTFSPARSHPIPTGLHVTFLLLGPDLFTTSVPSHISPFLASLAHLGPTLRMLALPHPPLLPLFLRHLVCPLISPGALTSQSVPPLPCPLATHSSSLLFPGVIFQTRKDGSLPPHVHYKIRQNSSFTEKTNEIRRAYWRPGPNTGGRFYFLYGFVWIQGEGLSPGGIWGWGGEPGLALIRLLPTDMMERAIINTFVGHDVVEPGNYVQMFPYPCYTRDE